MMAIEYDIEKDGRWIAEVPTLPGVLVYAATKADAKAKAKALALQVIAGRVKHREPIIAPQKAQPARYR
jgi:predicted RNase H-like HicB family nuclease